MALPETVAAEPDWDPFSEPSDNPERPLTITVTQQDIEQLWLGIGNGSLDESARTAVEIGEAVGFFHEQNSLLTTRVLKSSHDWTLSPRRP